MVSPTQGNKNNETSLPLKKAKIIKLFKFFLLFENVQTQLSLVRPLG